MCSYYFRMDTDFFMKEILLMKNILKNKFIKKVCLLVFVVYISVIMINQQKTINSYDSQQEYYESKIKDAQAYNETLISEKSNLNSEEYIEKIAREKLNMYTENERVYIDINN